MARANDHEWAKRAFDRQDEMHSDLVKAALDSAREAIRAALLLNGASCIALLGFLASLASSKDADFAAPLINGTKGGLKWFAAGALLAAFTAGLAYLVNSLYGGAEATKARSFEYPYITETKESAVKWRWANRLNWIAVLAIGLSYIVFIVGLCTIGSNL